MKRLRLEVPYPKQQTPHNVLEDLLKFQGIDKTNLSMSTICDKIATAVKEQLAVTKSTGERGLVLREDSSDKVLIGKVLVGAFAEPCTHLCASMRDDLLDEKPLTAHFLELTKYFNDDNDDRNDVEQIYDFQSVATYAIKECDILPLLLQIIETRVRSKLFLDAHAAVDLISSICDSLPRLTVPILLENGAIEILCSKLVAHRTSSTDSTSVWLQKSLRAVSAIGATPAGANIVGLTEGAIDLLLEFSKHEAYATTTLTQIILDNNVRTTLAKKSIATKMLGTINSQLQLLSDDSVSHLVVWSMTLFVHFGLALDDEEDTRLSEAQGRYIDHFKRPDTQVFAAFMMMSRVITGMVEYMRSRERFFFPLRYYEASVIWSLNGLSKSELTRCGPWAPVIIDTLCSVLNFLGECHKWWNSTSCSSKEYWFRDINVTDRVSGSTIVDGYRLFMKPAKPSTAHLSTYVIYWVLEALWNLAEASTKNAEHIVRCLSERDDTSCTLRKFVCGTDCPTCEDSFKQLRVCAQGLLEQLYPSELARVSLLSTGKIRPEKAAARDGTEKADDIALVTKIHDMLQDARYEVGWDMEVYDVCIVFLTQAYSEDMSNRISLQRLLRQKGQKKIIFVQLVDQLAGWLKSAMRSIQKTNVIAINPENKCKCTLQLRALIDRIDAKETSPPVSSGSIPSMGSASLVPGVGVRT
jgi:hypothetical protein